MKRLLIVTALLAGCAAQPPAAPPPDPPPPPPKPTIVIPDDPMAGLPQEVRAAIESHQTPTLHDGIATIYPYAPNQQWSIYCQPLHVTEIRLGSDEEVNADGVIIGDKDRWKVQVLPPNVIRVQPLATSADPAMSTDIVIDTDKRSYRLVLKLRSRFTQTVEWFYPDDVRAAEAAREKAIQETSK